jgi:hypothetical protein
LKTILFFRDSNGVLCLLLLLKRVKRALVLSVSVNLDSRDTQTLFLMMLKRLKELDKSIIRDPVFIPSQLFPTSSPLRYVAGKAKNVLPLSS